jgi:hypothetical protein
MKYFEKNKSIADNKSENIDKNNEVEDNSNESIINVEVKFENDSVDPGFETDHDKIRSDAGELRPKTLKEASKSLNSENSDALNYKNDRRNGAFNPKNI